MSTSTGTVTWVALISFILGVAVAAVTITLTDGRIIGIEDREVPAACMDEGRYPDKDKGISGEPLGKEQGTEMVKRFFEHVYGLEREIITESESIFPPNFSNVPADKPAGAFISKKVLDAIFSNRRNANGVMCYFGWEGDEDGKIQLMLTPAVHPETGVTLNNEHNIYMIKSYCPPRCFDVQRAEPIVPHN